MKFNTSTVLGIFTVYAVTQVTNELKFTGIWILDTFMKGFLCLFSAACVAIIVTRIQEWYKKK